MKENERKLPIQGISFALDGLSISEMKTDISYLMHLRRDVSLKL